MTASQRPAGDPYPYFFSAAVCFLAFCIVVGVSYIDAMDGETRARRSGIVRLADDPAKFRGTLVLNYGLYGIGALIGSFAAAAGGVGVHHANQSRKS